MRPSMVIYPLRQIYYSWSVSNHQYFGYLVGVTGGCDVTDTLLVGSYLHKLGLLSHNIFLSIIGLTMNTLRVLKGHVNLSLQEPFKIII